MLNDHVTACRRSCHVLKVLAHQAVPATWVSRVHDLHLLTAITCGIASLLTKEELFVTLVAVDVL